MSNQETGINYYLDRIPNGYQVMDYPKSGDPGYVGSRIFNILFYNRTLTDNSDTNACWATLVADSTTRHPDSSFTSCG